MTQKLPQSVQRQIEEAEAIERELYGEATDGESQAQGDEPKPEDTEVPTKQSEPSPGEEPETPAPPKAEPDVQSEPEVEAKDASETRKWEDRYRTLQGKYSAEVPALHAQVRELTAFVQQLRTQAEAATKEPPAPKAPDVTAEDEEMFGADVVDLARRVAKREIMQHLQGFESEAAAIKADMGRVQERVTETDYERFLDKVARAVPNMEQINASEPWLQWLAVHDPLLGSSRQKALESAANARDVGRTEALFKAFMATQAPAHAPAAPPPPRNTEVEDASIVPRTQGASPPAATSGSKRFFTEAEVGQLLDPRYLSKLPSDKARQIENEIDMASAEGRIL